MLERCQQVGKMPLMRLDCCLTFGIDMCQGLLRIRMKLHAEKFIKISFKYFFLKVNPYFSQNLWQMAGLESHEIPARDRFC